MTDVPHRDPMPTFIDHCVANPAWLIAASRQTSPTSFTWHQKILKALELVTTNLNRFDQNVYRFPGLSSGDVAAQVSQRKQSFFSNREKLYDVLDRIDRAGSRVFQELQVAPPKHRSRGLHTFAAAASLTVIRLLQRFEGALFTDSGQLIVRMFPDLPSMRLMWGPIVGLPFQHPVNRLAYGHEATNGFLLCRISRGAAEGDYEYAYLPRFDAETFQDVHPAPSHLYDGWVLPQWLLSFSDPPPARDLWRVTVLRDEQGVEKYTQSRQSPWSGPDAARLELPSEYDFPSEFYSLSEIAPGIPCWVTRATFGGQATRPITSSPGANVFHVTLAESADEPKRNQTPQKSVLCVAAAQAELTAILAQLTSSFGRGNNRALVDGADWVVRFLDPETQDIWFVVSLSFQGEVEAALRVKSVSAALAPTLILMIGMCMGMPRRRLKFGTVVVPNEVVTFDHQRLTSTGTTYRPHGARVDTGLYRLARILGTQSLPYAVVLDKGLASASAKIEHVNASLVGAIESSFPDAVAYDMEGWGFYQASNGTDCLWIKAVADSGEAQGQSGEQRIAKNAEQADATLNALDFAIRLIREHGVARAHGDAAFRDDQTAGVRYVRVVTQASEMQGHAVDVELLRVERLMETLFAQMRVDLREHPLVRTLVPLEKGWAYWGDSKELVYYYEDESDLGEKLQVLCNSDLIRDVSHGHTKRYLMSEKLVQYLVG